MKTNKADLQGKLTKLSKYHGKQYSMKVLDENVEYPFAFLMEGEIKFEFSDSEGLEDFIDVLIQDIK